MKILMIAPTPFFSDRGTHIRILEEALGLERRGHEVHVLTYHLGDHIPPSFESTIRIHRIAPLLFWYRKREAGPSWQKLILDYQMVWKMITLMEKIKPDVVHAHLHEGILIGWLVQRLMFWKRIPMLIDLHGSMTQEMVSHTYLRFPVMRRFFEWLERTINRMGHAAIASSVENTEQVQRDRGDRKKVHTIQDGVNTAAYQHATALSKRDLRSAFALPTDKILITYTGAFLANKGIDLFLKSIPLVVKQAPHVHVVLAGAPGEVMKEYVKEEGLHGSVSVISPLSYGDVPRLLAASDIAVDPKSVASAQASGKLLHYMAAGLPIVCMDRETNRRYLANGGLYVTEETPEAFAEAILSFIQDAKRRATAGEINRTRAAEYNWNHSAQQIEQLYTSIL